MKHILRLVLLGWGSVACAQSECPPATELTDAVLGAILSEPELSSAREAAGLPSRGPYAALTPESDSTTCDTLVGLLERRPGPYDVAFYRVGDRFVGVQAPRPPETLAAMLSHYSTPVSVYDRSLEHVVTLVR